MEESLGNEVEVEVASRIGLELWVGVRVRVMGGG